MTHPQLAEAYDGALTATSTTRLDVEEKCDRRLIIRLDDFSSGPIPCADFETFDFVPLVVRGPLSICANIFWRNPLVSYQVRLSEQTADRK